MEANAMESYRSTDLQKNADLTATIFNQKRQEREANRLAAEEVSRAAHAAISASSEIDTAPPGGIGPQIPGQSSSSSPEPPTSTQSSFGLKKIEAPTSGTKWHKELEAPDAFKGGNDGSSLKKWYEAIMDDGSGIKYYWHVETNGRLPTYLNRRRCYYKNIYLFPESRWEPPEEGYLSIKEQTEINRKSELKCIKKNASIAASQAIHSKKGVISSASEAAMAAASAASSYGPETKYDPYGGWQTVKEK